MTKALLCLPSVSYSVVKDRRERRAGTAGVVACRPVVLPADARSASRSIKAGTAGRLSNLVEIAGLEPAASGLQSRRSPS